MFGKKNILILLVLLVFSLLFRVSFLSIIEFKTDEAVTLFLATRPWFGYFFPAGSTVSSFGILNPPLLLYLLFPFTAISFDPRIISGGIGVINALSILFYFVVIKKYYGQLTAFVSSILLSLSPWAILFSRKIWPQDFIIPLTVPLVLSIHKILIDKKPKYWLIYMLFSMLLIQIHQAAVFFIVPLTVFMFLQKPARSIKHIVIGILLGFIPLLHYLYFEVSNGFINLQQILGVSGEVSTKSHLLVFFRPFQIMSQGNFFFVIGNSIVDFAVLYPFVYSFRMVFYLEYVLLLLGAIVFFIKYKKLRFFIYTIITLPVLYFVFRFKPEMHYFIILLPFMLIFIGAAFSYLFEKGKIIKILSIALFTAFVFESLLFNYSFFSFIKSNEGLSGDYGGTFGPKEEIVKKRLKSYENTKDYKELVIASYIPRGFLRGDNILSSVLYDIDEIEKNIPELDEKLKVAPEDIRIENMLFAYYTRQAPTRETLSILRNKINVNDSYPLIYEEAYSMYLRQNLTKALFLSSNGVMVEYPLHWETTQDNGITVIFGDGIRIHFYRGSQCEEKGNEINGISGNTVSILGQSVQEVICEGDSWCGSLYCPIETSRESMSISINPDLDQEDIVDYEKNRETIEKILDSLRNTSGL